MGYGQVGPGLDEFLEALEGLDLLFDFVQELLPHVFRSAAHLIGVAELVVPALLLLGLLVLLRQ